MVQTVLKSVRRFAACAFLAAGGLALLAPAPAWGKTKKPEAPPEKWLLSLEGGRSLAWERNIRSEAEVKPDRGFWNKLVDVIAGAPEFRFLVRPYGLAVDSRGRILVTDPGVAGVHIFDFGQRKYKFVQRRPNDADGMQSPQCIAVDAQDNFYVTDSMAGEIFVFDANGKYQRRIGHLKGGEGYFKRPTGIAVDSQAQRIFVTDTLRDQVFVLDMQGVVLQTIGHSGSGQGEFNLPTELRLDGPNLLVVDAMNFRVQVLDRSGAFQSSFGILGGEPGALYRPKAMGIDSENHLYIVDAEWGVVQVFDRQGRLLY